MRSWKWTVLCCCILFKLDALSASAFSATPALSSDLRLIHHPPVLTGFSGRDRPAPTCLTLALAEARKNWEHLDPALRLHLESFFKRPTDDSEPLGTQDVSYAAFGANTVASHTSSPFRIWYALDSPAAVSALDISPANQVPDYVDQVAQTLQEVYLSMVEGMGYLPPPGDGAIGGGTNLYDVYLTELSDTMTYGFAVPEFCSGTPLTCSSYLVMDNDFAEDIYSVKGLTAVQVTAAHEFFHAIHFAYELEGNFWWLENTAVWMEDIVYDDVNDYATYLPAHARDPGLPLDILDGVHEYANMVWPTYLAEAFGPDFVLHVFEQIAEIPGDNTLSALDDELAFEDTSLIDALAEFNTFNQNKTRYEEGYLFWGNIDEITPTATINSFPWATSGVSPPGGALEPLSAQFIRFEPPTEWAGGLLLLDVDGRDHPAFRARAVLETACNTSYERTIDLDETSAGVIEIDGFSAAQVGAVTLVVTNGCYEEGCEAVLYSVDASLLEAPVPADSDQDCVPHLTLNGMDCDDEDSSRGPFAKEIPDGIDNDCDGALDESPGASVLYPDTLWFIQGQDYDLNVSTRYLQLDGTETFSWSRRGASITSHESSSSLSARVGGMIGILAPSEPILAITNSAGRATGVVYVNELKKESLVTLRPSQGTLSCAGAAALFEVENTASRTLLAKATSNGAHPFTPQLRWIDTDGTTEITRHTNSAGLEASKGTIFLRVSDSAGLGGEGYTFSLTLQEGCSEDSDADGHISDACPGGDDCNDLNARAHPGATEIPYDGIDQDCLDDDLVDQDGDGFAAMAVGGSDCDDLDPNASPDGFEVCDLSDNDCDGVSNEGLEDCDLEVCDGLDNDGNGSVDEGFDQDGSGGADCTDDDNDGYSEVQGDCNDEDEKISPDASDIPYDGVDQDCVGGDLRDLDLDGYQAAASGGPDCDDQNASVHPGAPELCDDIDNNCNEEVDEGTDFDGIGGPDCLDGDGDGYNELEGDCQDEDPSIYPVAVEIPYDGIDQDCSGKDQIDVDQDGYTASEAGGNDCVDTSPVSYPGATEICDALDNDCDHSIDEGFDADGIGGSDCVDNDGDGYTELEGDCRDDDSADAAALSEICDGKDNDCDDWVDEGYDEDRIGGADCLDEDQDGYTEYDGDCDDEAPEVYPAQEETCDTVDNNCDGGIDEGFDLDGIGGPDCTDNDHDKYSEDEGDCDDEDRSAYPGGVDIPYNGLDEDCSGADLTDQDGDGHDSDWVEGGDDCDDEDPRAYPGATEIAYNNIDENCDGYDFQDADLDGHPSVSAGGDDCDDFNPFAYPGAEEIPYNGVDDDCSKGDLTDVDGDLFDGSAEEGEGEDCDDSDPLINPYAEDIPYDGIDQDCDGNDLTDVDWDNFDGEAAGGPDCNDEDPETNPRAEEICDDGIDNNCVDGIDEGCSVITPGCSCKTGSTDVPGSNLPTFLAVLLNGLLLLRVRQARFLLRGKKGSLPTHFRRLDVDPGNLA